MPDISGIPNLSNHIQMPHLFLTLHIKQRYLVFLFFFFLIETNTWPAKTTELMHYHEGTIFKMTFPCYLIYDT